MTDLETRLRSTFADHEDSVRIDADFLQGAIHKGKRRAARRRNLAVGAVVLALGATAVGLAALGGNEKSDVVASAGDGQWSPVDISDPAVFAGEGDMFITAITQWKDQMVVLGVLQAASGRNTVLAWTSANGIDWEKNELEWPTGCQLNGGLEARGEELLVTCGSAGGEDAATLEVATTRDLKEWNRHSVADGFTWFGSLIGSGPDDKVIVQALEAEDPNTTVGARTRVWSSSDLVIWSEMAGETPETFLNGQVTAIRTFGESTIITGMVNEWPAEVGPNTPAVMRPAVWVSTAGSPFRRTVLEPAEPSIGLDGAVMDVVASNNGYVAVGSAAAGSTGIAWYSTDLIDWQAVVVASSGSSPDLPGGGLSAITKHDDGTLIAVGGAIGAEGSNTLAWKSINDGRSWHATGSGPSIITGWDNKSVGMSSWPEPAVFWIWIPA